MEEKTYSVGRYFDDHLVQIIEKDLSLKDAKELRDKLRRENSRPYTSYEVI